MASKQCKCGKDAFNQCSRCHNRKYCSIECARRFWPEHKRSCFGINKELVDNMQNTNLREALRVGTFSNYQFYESICEDHRYARTQIPPDIQARRFLYRGLVHAALLDPTGLHFMEESPLPPFSHTWSSVTQDIMMAGSLFNQLGGLARMQSEYVFPAVPPCLKMLINTRWDKIGTWTSE
jgi:hypothetical protein